MKLKTLWAWVVRQADRAVAAAVVVIVGVGAAWFLRQPLREFFTKTARPELAYWHVALLLVAVLLVGLAGWLLAHRKILGRCPAWEKYTSDSISGVAWHWTWPRPPLFDLRTADVRNVREMVSRLRPYCPQCDGVLYNRALDPSAGYIGRHQNDAPRTEPNQLKCMTCRFETSFRSEYNTVALETASEIVRRARDRYLPRRARPTR